MSPLQCQLYTNTGSLPLKDLRVRCIKPCPAGFLLLRGGFWRDVTAIARDAVGWASGAQLRPRVTPASFGRKWQHLSTISRSWSSVSTLSAFKGRSGNRLFPPPANRKRFVKLLGFKLRNTSGEAHQNKTPQPEHSPSSLPRVMECDFRQLPMLHFSTDSAKYIEFECVKRNTLIPLIQVHCKQPDCLLPPLTALLILFETTHSYRNVHKFKHLKAVTSTSIINFSV